MFQKEGPYLRTAVLCKDVLEEKDGTLSLIRILDTIVQRQAPDGPDEMPNFDLNVNAVISFKAGESTGDFTTRMELTSPSGRVLEESSHKFSLKHPGGGQNFIANFAFEATEEGLHWVNVYLDEELITRMPLRIGYEHVDSDSN